MWFEVYKTFTASCPPPLSFLNFLFQKNIRLIERCNNSTEFPGTLHLNSFNENILKYITSNQELDCYNTGN